MNGPRVTVTVEFDHEGHTREPFYLDLRLRNTGASDEDIAEAVRDALVEHMEDNPRVPVTPLPERCAKTIDMFGVAP